MSVQYSTVMDRNELELLSSCRSLGGSFPILLSVALYNLLQAHMYHLLIEIVRLLYNRHVIYRSYLFTSFIIDMSFTGRICSRRLL